MLLSFLNMKLRDHYSSLTELVDDLAIGQEELKGICEKLAAVDYHYDAGKNAFV